VKTSWDQPSKVELRIVFCLWSKSTAHGAKILAMELIILTLEPKILASEPRMPAFGVKITGLEAQNIGDQKIIFGLEMMSQHFFKMKNKT